MPNKSFGPARRERELIANFQLPIVDLKRAHRVNSDISCFVSEPGAVATGSKTQLESQHSIISVARLYVSLKQVRNAD